MNLTLTGLALFTGVFAGALFSYLQIPIPAPPELPGLMGIVGIYGGYKLIQWMNIGFDLLAALGIK